MCDHQNFVTNCTVHRLTDEVGKVTGYSMDLRVECADCELPFEFIANNCAVGILNKNVTKSLDNKELRIPIRPSTDPIDTVNAILK